MPSRFTTILSVAVGSRPGNEDVVVVGAGLGALDHDVEAAPPAGGSTARPRRGLLQGVEEVALEKTGCRPVAEHAEPPVDFPSLLLIVEDLLEFVGAGAHLGFDPGTSLLASVARSWRTLLQTSTSAMISAASQRARIDRVAAAHFLGDLGFREKV